MSAARWLVIAAAGLLVPAVHAAFESDMEFRDYTLDPPRAFKALVRVDELKVQADTSQFTGEKTELVYRGENARIFHIKHDRREYLEIDENLVARFSKGVSQARDTWTRVKDRLFSPKAASSESGQDLTLRETGVRRVVLGQPADQYQVLQGSVLLQEIWAAPLDELGLGEPDVEALHRLFASYEHVQNAVGGVGMPGVSLEKASKVAGFPLVLRHYSAEGKMLYEVRFMPPRLKSVNAQLFMLPQGYRRTLL